MAIGNIRYVVPPLNPPEKCPDVIDGDAEQSEQKPSAADDRREQRPELSAGAESLGIVSRPPPAFPDYSTVSARVKSFENYPRHCKGNPLRMAKAGLFYNGFGENDRVVCFQCAGALYKWEDDDVPLEEHARWYPTCPFVRLALGQPGLKRLTEAHEAALKKASEVTATEDEIEALTQYYNNREGQRFFEGFGITKATLYNAMKGMLDRGEDIYDADKVEAALKSIIGFEERPVNETQPASDVSLCAVCCSDERGIIFFPCGHVATCVNCAATATTCPICRSNITGSMKAFLS